MQITSVIRHDIYFNAFLIINIGRHLKDCHGNINFLKENNFSVLKKCCTKWDCLINEMLFISKNKTELEHPERLP